MKAILALMIVSLSLAAAAVSKKRMTETQLRTKGYTMLENSTSYYKIYETGKQYEEAWFECKADGALLFIPNSQEEVNAVYTLMTQYPSGTEFLIGADDLHTEGTFVTVKGTLLADSGYNYWRDGEPNNLNNEDCAAIVTTGLFNDRKCDITLPFICEYEP